MEWSKGAVGLWYAKSMGNIRDVCIWPRLCGRPDLISRNVMYITMASLHSSMELINGVFCGGLVPHDAQLGFFESYFGLVLLLL